jgi:3-oxoacyl-[acyl-carrier-protein] synthase III
MRIAAVARAIPGQRVSNERILEELRIRNRHLSAPTLERLQRKVAQALRIAGTETRYVLADDESGSELVLCAARRALAQAELRAADLDFIIYTGVGRGCIEPAMASTIQPALGAVNATCFDIMDACASWLRALHVAHCYLATGAHRRGMIVNCEAGLASHIAWDFDSPDELDHRFAALTIGEAATATVVTHTPADDFYFTFRTFGEHAHRCTIPQPNFPRFFPEQAANGQYAPGRFFARSSELFPIVTDLIVDVWRKDAKLCGDRYDVAFGHEASERLSADITAKLGVREIYFPIHRRFGNTVSASVPLAMSLASEEDRLARGDRVLVIIGSAGISVGFATFTF